MLARPTFEAVIRFGTASAGQAMLDVQMSVVFARPEQWHV